jgi:integrase
MSTSKSSFVDVVTRYLAQRRALGFDLRIAGKRLLVFARFADQHAQGGPLTIALALAWAHATSRPSQLTSARRLEIVRPFAQWLRQLDPRTEVPPARLLGRAHRRLVPHIYTHDELRALLAEADRLTPPGGLRPASLVALLGLLASTGMRVSEALALRRSDVDLEAGLLHVRQTKFRKSRLVPLHPTTVTALRSYAALCDRPAPGHARDDAFFVVDGGIRLSYSKVRTAFRRIRIRLGWEEGSGRRPRIHDLRHTFACQRLLLWQEQRADVSRCLLDLCTYLGHAKVSDTYWYLSAFPELLELSAKRFEEFASARGEVRS